VILQDMPHSIANALQTPGVEKLVHDFYQPQPIKGKHFSSRAQRAISADACVSSDAKFYFLRGVLHDQPTHYGRKILEQTKAAMGPELVLLIDKMILPETGVNFIAASIDMTMLTAVAGLERTQAEWRALLEEVGLELVQTRIYLPGSYEGVMNVRLPRA
jgi:hypothetical protein